MSVHSIKKFVFCSTCPWTDTPMAQAQARTVARAWDDEYRGTRHRMAGVIDTPRGDGAYIAWIVLPLDDDDPDYLPIDERDVLADLAGQTVGCQLIPTADWDSMLSTVPAAITAAYGGAVPDGSLDRTLHGDLIIETVDPAHMARVWGHLMAEVR